MRVCARGCDRQIDIFGASQCKYCSGRYAAVHRHGNLQRWLDRQYKFDGHLDGRDPGGSDGNFERPDHRSSRGLGDGDCLAQRDHRECVTYRDGVHGHTRVDFSSAVERKHCSGRYAAVHRYGNLQRWLDRQCKFDGHLDGRNPSGSDCKLEWSGDRDNGWLNGRDCVLKRDHRERVIYRDGPDYHAIVDIGNTVERKRRRRLHAAVYRHSNLQQWLDRQCKFDGHLDGGNPSDSDCNFERLDHGSSGGLDDGDSLVKRDHGKRVTCRDGARDSHIDIGRAVERKRFCGRYPTVHRHGNLQQWLDRQCKFDGHLDGRNPSGSDCSFERPGDRDNDRLNGGDCLARRDHRERITCRDVDRCRNY